MELVKRTDRLLSNYFFIFLKVFSDYFSNKAEDQKRIKKLRREIARLRDAYHTENAPNVTDDVYDSLTRELKKLLETYPEFADICEKITRRLSEWEAEKWVQH